MIYVPNNAPEKVLNFVRQNEKDTVFAVLNFSDKPQTVTFKDEKLFSGKYKEYFSGKVSELNDSSKLELKPLIYQVFVK